MRHWCYMNQSIHTSVVALEFCWGTQVHIICMHTMLLTSWYNWFFKSVIWQPIFPFSSLQFVNWVSRSLILCSKLATRFCWTCSAELTSVNSFLSAFSFSANSVVHCVSWFMNDASWVDSWCIRAELEFRRSSTLDFVPWEERFSVSSDGRRVRSVGLGGRLLDVEGIGGGFWLSPGEPSDWVSGSVKTSTGWPPNQLCILFIVEADFLPCWFTTSALSSIS